MTADLARWENEGGSTKRHFPPTYHGCCGTPCFMEYDASSAQPCWGEITCVETDYDEESGDEYRTGACEGHTDLYLYREGYKYPEE